MEIGFGLVEIFQVWTGFILAETKFDAIPMLRAGEMVRMTNDDLYVMRGLLRGEAIREASWEVLFG